jgi:hypothetical protein
LGSSFVDAAGRVSQPWPDQTQWSTDEVASLNELRQTVELQCDDAGREADRVRAHLASQGLHDSLDFLRSDRAVAMIEEDPYWPKYDVPWWHMLLLCELGWAVRIPRRPLQTLIATIDRHYLHFFPLVPEDLPPGIDCHREILCHCALGSIAQVLFEAGIDVESVLPWFRPWILKYRLPDGGLNCREEVYTQRTPHSSFVSTMPPAEFILYCTERPLTLEEQRFVDGAAQYYLTRHLFRSLSRGMEPANRKWLVPAFPRFFEYDVLRGLRFVTRWAKLRDASLAWSDIAEVVEALDLWTRQGHNVNPPRRWFDPSSTLRRQPDGIWEKGQPAACFPLLNAAADPNVALALLRAEFVDTLQRLLHIHFDVQHPRT